MSLIQITDRSWKVVLYGAAIVAFGAFVVQLAFGFPLNGLIVACMLASIYSSYKLTRNRTN